MNNLIYQIALLGGLFAVLSFNHFFIDWIFQSHAEAMAKHNNAQIRAKHCFIYTLGFTPLFYVSGFGFWEWVIGLSILFWSHFIEDTYVPVFLWAKYIRRPPEMASNPKEGFALWVKVTVMGKILMIAIDQIIHLSFLFPIAVMLLHHCQLGQ